MSIASVGDILRDGYQKRYGVAAFDCYNFESIKYVIDVAEEENMPAIIMLYPSMISHIPLTTFAAITKDLAAKVKTPIGLHLDHCEDYNLLLQAMYAGFQSVIIDASKYDYETNLKMTKEISKVAHAIGCEVEAELGHVGSGNVAEDFTDKAKYTDPDLAAAFVRDGEVDYLAVAIGNGHGHYVVEPSIDLERVKAINAKLTVPLVIHGGSGIPDEQLADCVRNGVIKHNFGTYYIQAFFDGAVTAGNSPEARRSGLWLETASASTAKEFVRSRIRALNPDHVKP